MGRLEQFIKNHTKSLGRDPQYTAQEIAWFTGATLGQVAHLVAARTSDYFSFEDLITVYRECEGSSEARIEITAERMRFYPPVTCNHDAMSVLIDPAIQFGRPILAGSFLPVAPIAGRFLSGESIADLTYDYGVSSHDVEVCVRFVQTRKSILID